MCRQRVLRSPVFACIAAAMLACGKPDARPADTLTTRAPTVAVASDPSDWVSELGALLVVPSDSESAGVVLFPAAPSARLISSAPLTLLSASGDSFAARASLVESDSQVCGEAPTIRLGDSVAISWSVALLPRSATALHMDSIEALPSPDSARFAADLARLASAQSPARDSRFAGLPFVVLSARRFETRGQQIVVAHLVRRLPQEATPLEEHSLIVAERAASARSEPFVVTYHQRSEGTEETADHFEVLAVIRGAETTFLLLAREQDAQTRYEILERTKAGGWRMRWSRMLAC